MPGDVDDLARRFARLSAGSAGSAAASSGKSDEKASPRRQPEKPAPKSRVQSPPPVGQPCPLPSEAEQQASASGHIPLLGGGKKQPVVVSEELEDAIRGMTFTESMLEALTRDVLVHLCRFPEVNIPVAVKEQGRTRSLSKSELITKLLQKQSSTAVTVDADHQFKRSVKEVSQWIVEHGDHWTDLRGAMMIVVRQAILHVCLKTRDRSMPVADTRKCNGRERVAYIGGLGMQGGRQGI